MLGRTLRALLAGAAFAGLTLDGRDAAAQFVAREVPAKRIARLPLFLEAGREYQFETYDLDFGVDPVMHLLDPTNMEIDRNDDLEPGNPNARITFTASTTGIHYVVVRSLTEYVWGEGNLQWRSRVATDPWPDFTPLETDAFFGGAVVPIEPNQPEYRTVMRSLEHATTPGTPDTVLYTMDISQAITKYDDDSGVGRMERIYTPFTSYPTHYLLVGAFDAHGYADVMANDLANDLDGDGLGAGLEAALGICDSPTTVDGCLGRFNLQDTDHDGLSDKDEAFGRDYSNPNYAVHLPAWGADPRKKDVFIEQDFSTLFPAGTVNPFTQDMASKIATKFVAAPEADVMNMPGIGDGIQIHFDIGSSCPTTPTLCGDWGAGGTRSDLDSVHPSRIGLFRHFKVDPGDGGQAPSHPASYFKAGKDDIDRDGVHELGHALGLSHGGHAKWDTSDSSIGEVNCKPHYPSLMNYGYELPYWQSWFSSGSNPGTLDPANASENDSMFLDPASAGPLMAGAYNATTHRFPITNSMSGLVDWNRDGFLAGGVVRGALIAGTGQCSAHRLVTDEVEADTAVGNATPDLAAYYPAGRLYAFFASSDQKDLRYRATLHSGNSGAGGGWRRHRPGQRPLSHVRGQQGSAGGDRNDDVDGHHRDQRLAVERTDGRCLAHRCA